MKIRFLADADFNKAILNGILRRDPSVDFQSAFGAGLKGKKDPEVLAYQGTEDLFAYLLERYAAYSGISGVQPKVLLRDPAGLDRLTHRGATHIVKAFEARDYPELAANEWICTQGAAAAGIQTANMRLSANRQMLVVDRFDLTPQGEYFGIEDFCVLNGMRSQGRYDGSYENIARRISDFVSPGSLARAREQFALMVAYSCAIENGDAHLKNFSVLYGNPEAEIGLAPAYDLLSTTLYNANDLLALTLGGTKTFPRHSQATAFIRQVTGKSEGYALKLLDCVSAGVREAIRQATLYAERYSDAGNFSEKLIETMTRGLGRLTAR